jgi:ferredoxin-NADP reductase
VARATLQRRLNWQVAEVAESVEETAGVRSLVLNAPEWAGHRAGQHVDVRLTAEDGYQAVRSYSIASAPAGGALVVTIERLDDGEVSPYLVDELRPGDKLERRGPIGGYFVWDSSTGGPLLLVGGGSGIVPLMAILRERVATGSDAAVRLLASWRTAEDIIYRAELEQLGALEGVEVVHTLTRGTPEGWGGRSGRIDRAMLTELTWPPDTTGLSFVCGPTGLVEAVAGALAELGHAPGQIKTERFGPTGG